MKRNFLVTAALTVITLAFGTTAQQPTPISRITVNEANAIAKDRTDVANIPKLDRRSVNGDAPGIVGVIGGNGGTVQPPPPRQPDEPAFAEDRVIVKLANTQNARAMTALAANAGTLPDLGIAYSEARLINPSKNNANIQGFSAMSAGDNRQNNVYVLTLEEAGKDAVERALKILNANPAVEFAEPSFLYRANLVPNDGNFIDSLYAMVKINAFKAWDETTGSKDVVVGIIDSGIDGTHPDLVDNLWRNPNPNQDTNYKDDDHGYDFVTRQGGTPTDPNGHGTHVAGTVGAKGDNNKGVAGVNWDVSLVSLRFLNDEGKGYTEHAIEAITYASNRNVHILNNSWGGGSYSLLLREAICNYDGLFVVAAGNDYGNNNDLSPVYPANYDCQNIISVASTTEGDDLSTFTNYGSDKVHIAAPGTGIWSTYPGSRLAKLNGTSMAAPHVTGVAALLLAKEPTLTAAQLKERILSTAQPMRYLTGYVQESRFLDAHAALTNYTSHPTLPPIPPPTVITAFPYNESFEDKTVCDVCLPEGWSQDIVGGNGRWIVAGANVYGTLPHPHYVPNGSRKIYTFSAVEAPDSRKIKLIMPPMDLNGLAKPELTFWHTQGAWSNPPDIYDQDTLRIFYKTSAGGAWTLLKEYVDDIGDWTHTSVLLPNKSDDYYIAFEGETRYGYGIQLDDIKVDEATPPPTPAATVTQFPYEEGFEGAADGWMTARVVGTSDWEVVPGNYYGIPPTTAHSGSKKAFLFQYGNYPITNKTMFISPPMDLSGLTNPTLTFWHAQKEWEGIQDYLRIYYKTSAAGQWTLLEEYLTEIPNWTKRTISLPNSSTEYHIGFEGQVQWGEGVHLDDIKVFNAMRVTFSSTGGGAITATANGGPITSGADIDEGSDVVFTAKPDHGWVIKQWTHNGAVLPVPHKWSETFELPDIDEAADVTVEFERIPDGVFVVYGGEANVRANQTISIMGGSTSINVNEDIVVDIELRKDNAPDDYVLVIGALDLSGIVTPPVVMNSVNISMIENGYKFTRSGGVSVDIHNVNLRDVLGIENTLISDNAIVPVTITLQSAQLVNGVLRMQFDAVAATQIFIFPISVTFNITYEGKPLFGPIPPTGLPDMTFASALMFALFAGSALLWGYAFTPRRKFDRG